MEMPNEVVQNDPPEKKVTLNLTSNRYDKDMFKVVKIVNSVDWYIGQILTKNEVQLIIDSQPLTKVVISFKD